MNPRILIYLNILFFLTFLYSSDLHPPSRDCIEDDFGDCCDEPFQVWYDEDNDGLGDPENSALACLEYANWVTNNDDPNDNCFSNIIDCNGTCNGTWVEDFFGDCCEETTTMWQDFDYDGWGNFNVSVETCQFYVGWVYNYVDKNDSTFCQSNVFDACGICDGDNSSCTGCTDPEAINYEVENEIDDDSCVYPSDHIWHVSLLGSDETGTGTVENPFFTVNRGIEASSDSDTILVHTGIHYGTVNFSGKNVLLTTLFEFTGDSTHLFNTILDGNDEVTVVRFENGENEEAVISGFSIRNGYGNLGPGGQNFLGGGIICTYSSPTIRNLLIYDNYADYGGGIFLWHYSNANIHDISVYDNLASVGGGLCFHWDCNPLVENFLVRNNHATVDAGGVSYEKYCSGIIRNGIIKNNSTTLRGGAMLIWDGSHPV
ncbi:MAG: hypothetical protein H8D46_03070, partial [FCB group bacterium]|nr:hypothetical protein [FCB group bacterium]